MHFYTFGSWYLLKFLGFSLWKVLYHKGILYCFWDDILQCIRRTCILAHTSFLLDGTLYDDHEETDITHD